MVDSISASVLFCNTENLIEKSIGSFRQFYPDMKLLVVDNSDDGVCTLALKKYIQNDPHAIIFKTEKNFGHGIGADLCIRKSLGKYVYIFESDVVMFKGGLIEAMMELMDEKTYGIGRIDDIIFGTYDFAPPDYIGRTRKRIWIFSALINHIKYLEFPPFDSDRGTNAEPVLKAMMAIEAIEGIENVTAKREKRQPVEILKHFDTEQYVQHLYGGTRLKIGIPDLPDYKNIKKYDQ